jgi:hypothetical protein
MEFDVKCMRCETVYTKQFNRTFPGANILKIADANMFIARIGGRIVAPCPECGKSTLMLIVTPVTETVLTVKK